MHALLMLFTLKPRSLLLRNPIQVHSRHQPYHVSILRRNDRRIRPRSLLQYRRPLRPSSFFPAACVRGGLGGCRQRAWWRAVPERAMLFGFNYRRLGACDGVKIHGGHVLEGRAFGGIGGGEADGVLCRCECGFVGGEVFNALFATGAERKASVSEYFETSKRERTWHNELHQMQQRTQRCQSS